MGRFQALIVPALVALSATGCMSGKAMKVENPNRMLKDAMPASAVTPALASKSPPATQFAAAWQTKLGQLPDPTKNGVMNRGIVGQAFLYTDALAAADIVGTLTVVVNDATDRANGQPARQPNVWHFDAETLKRMVVNDDRFGKSIALFLPWPEEWVDVNRLYVQARYDQPNSYTVYAPPATVTLDLFSTTPFQTTHSAARVSASQMTVPDPKVLMQNARATTPVTPASTTSNVMPVASPPSQPNGSGWPVHVGLPPSATETNPVSMPPREFSRMVIPRN